METKRRGRPPKSENSTNTETTPTGDTTPTTPTDTTGPGGEPTGELGREVSEVNLVEVEPVKKKRGRPKGTKSSTGKKDKAGLLSCEDLNPLLQGVFTLVGSKFGSHWLVSEEEVSTITKPLVKILDKMDLSEKVSNISDGAGLLMAVVSIVLPRLLLTDFNKKEKVKKVLKENGGIKENDQKREIRKDNQENNGGDKVSDGNDVKSLHNEIFDIAY